MPDTVKDSLDGSFKESVKQGLKNMFNPFYYFKEFVGIEGLVYILKKIKFKDSTINSIGKFLGLDLESKDAEIVKRNRIVFVAMTCSLWLFQLIQTLFEPFHFIIDLKSLDLGAHLLLMGVSYSFYFIIKTRFAFVQEPEAKEDKKLNEIDYNGNSSPHLKKTYKLSDYLSTTPIKEDLMLPFLLGVDARGRVIVADLAKLKNILIAGAPGGGKSVILNSFITGLNFLCGRNGQDCLFILVDFKSVELCYYEKFDNTVFVETLEDFEKKLDKLLAEMERRYKVMRGRATNVCKLSNKEDFPFIVLVIDEVSEIKLNAEDNDETRRIEKKVIRLQNKGRAACIVTVIATQRSNKDQLSPDIKANSNVTISCKIVNKATQNVVGVTGTEHLEQGEFKTVLEGQTEGQIYKGFYVDMSEDYPQDHINYDQILKVKGGVNLEKN